MGKRIVVASLAMLAAAALLTTAAPATEPFHLELDHSVPANEQVVAASPAKIVLDFSEKPELAVSKVTVTGGGGVAAKLGKVQYDEKDDSIIWTAVEEPLADGAYTVSWLTSSDDGHPVRGEFTFTLRAAH